MKPTIKITGRTTFEAVAALALSLTQTHPDHGDPVLTSDLIWIATQSTYPREMRGQHSDYAESAGGYGGWNGYADGELEFALWTSASSGATIEVRCEAGHWMATYCQYGVPSRYLAAFQEMITDPIVEAGSHLLGQMASMADLEHEIEEGLWANGRPARPGATLA